ncbi:MAG: U32 family peptidase [Eubacteriales bacterium]|nr:U32 family peptidase [Eubacteriales bacterium]
MTCVKNNQPNKKRSDNPIPELLAPCGSAESIDAAVLGGADAVYLGGPLFNARINARNFTDDALREAIIRCHAAGIKVYITLNTQIYDRETEDALRYAAFLYEAGADALIIADLGLASLIRRYMPAFALHASTQVSGHNAAAAVTLSVLGFSRMVCARELSAENVALLVKKSPLDIEMFIHGAICVSHSGQCLLSFVMGGRSGNRGECAQPCRMSYNGGYPLSLSDLCLAAHIPEIIDSGVASLKIEGRMKPPEYVYEVTSLYRRLLDQRRPATHDEIKRLASVFSRSGFTDGYYKKKIDAGMMGVRTDRDKAATNAVKTVFSPSGRAAQAIRTEKRVASLPEKPFTRRTRPSVPDKIRNTARFLSPDKIIGGNFFDTVYLPLALYKKTADNVTGVVLPGVISDLETAQTDKLLKKAYENGARQALAGNIGHIEIARQYGFEVYGDFGLNIFNSFTAAVYDDLGGVILSPELTLPQIRDIAIKDRKGKGVIVYGRLPVMLLEKPAGTALLRDRKGIGFPVIHSGGRDILLNSLPVYMADKGLDGCGIDNRHYIFTVESRREAEAVVEAYKKGTPPSGRVRRVKQ